MDTNTAKRRQTLFSFRNKLILGFSLPIILIILLAIFTNRSMESVRAEYTAVSEDITPIPIALENLRFLGIHILASADHSTGNDVGMAIQIFRRAVKDDVEPQG